MRNLVNILDLTVEEIDDLIKTACDVIDNPELYTNSCRGKILGIEPFDFSEAVDFQTAYLSGYLADKYDVSEEKSVPRANERIRVSTAAAFDSTVHGYTTVTPQHTSIHLHGGKAKYALYPVWVLNTTWDGKQYTFAMNGQTGKLVGDLPMDKSLYAKWLFGIAGVCGAVAMGLSWLIWLL